MVPEVKGRVWLLPDDVTTAQIAPRGDVIDVREIDPKVLLFQDLFAGLADRIADGDILWAGEGFGQGGSREDAPRLLARAGIRVVLAESFARSFYRNAINIGLPVAVGLRGETRDGDEMMVNLASGEVHNVTQDVRTKVELVPKPIRPILAEGGLIAYIRAHGRLPQESSPG
jgi:3-isopropylmalate/(R)-2-methylmalate dehydratase small subunit